MDFINEIGKKTSKVCNFTVNKTNEIAKETKYKMKMMSYKSKIEELYEDIGKKVYQNYVYNKKEDIEELTLEECIEIDKIASQIEDYRKEILKLKNKKQCPDCFFEIKSYYKFCPNCGHVQQENNSKVENEKQNSDVVIVENSEKGMESNGK